MQIGLQPCHKKLKSFSVNRRLIFKTEFFFHCSQVPEMQLQLFAVKNSDCALSV